MAYPWGSPSSVVTHTRTNAPARAPVAAPAPAPVQPVKSYSVDQSGNKTFYGLGVNELLDIADPWRSQRGQYQTALSKMISDPSSFTSSQLFQSATQAGIDAVNRQAASRGLLKSGNRLTALMDYGQQKAPETFFKMADLLTTLGGARNQNPGGGLTAAAQLAGAQTAARQADISGQNAETNRYQAETGRMGVTNQANQAAQSAANQQNQWQTQWNQNQLAQQSLDEAERNRQTMLTQQQNQQSLSDFMNSMLRYGM